MRSEANNVEQYLAELPPERREVIEIVRRTTLEHLPDGYEEVMNWGMITYQVPWEIYQETYNKQPLMYAALASQKSHMAVYLSGIYMDPTSRKEFETAYKATGKRLDAGKSCVRFKKLDDLPLPLIGEVIASMPMHDFVRRVEAIHAQGRRRRG